MVYRLLAVSMSRVRLLGVLHAGLGRGGDGLLRFSSVRLQGMLLTGLVGDFQLVVGHVVVKLAADTRVAPAGSADWAALRLHESWPGCKLRLGCWQLM